LGATGDFSIVCRRAAFVKPGLESTRLKLGFHRPDRRLYVLVNDVLVNERIAQRADLTYGLRWTARPEGDG
jgi:hypothetical protein